MSTLAEGVYFIRNVQSKTLITLDLSASPSPTLVGSQFNFDELDQQLFSIKTIGQDNKYLIAHAKTGQVFDLSGGETADYTPIIVYPIHFGDNQSWNVNPSANGVYKIHNVRSGDLVDLRSGESGDNTPIWNFRDLGTDNQLWEFKRVGPYVS